MNNGQAEAAQDSTLLTRIKCRQFLGIEKQLAARVNVIKLRRVCR